MSKRIDDGGPAFPTTNLPTRHVDAYTEKECRYGMSLRDWFAGMAMQAMTTGVDEPNETWIASHAYFLADAMIAERNKTK